MIEADRVELLRANAEIVPHALERAARARGSARCPAAAAIALWSNYAGRRRRGTLRARRHARRAGSAAAGHSHLHDVQAALGRAAGEGAPALAEYYDRKSVLAGRRVSPAGLHSWVSLNSRFPSAETLPAGLPKFTNEVQQRTPRSGQIAASLDCLHRPSVAAEAATSRTLTVCCGCP